MDVYNGTYTDTIGRSQGYPEVFLQRNTQTTEAQRAVFEKAYAAGVTLLYGTDAAVLPHDYGGVAVCHDDRTRHDTHGGYPLRHIGCCRAPQTRG